MERQCDERAGRHYEQIMLVLDQSIDWTEERLVKFIPLNNYHFVIRRNGAVAQ